MNQLTNESKNLNNKDIRTYKSDISNTKLRYFYMSTTTIDDVLETVGYGRIQINSIFLCSLLLITQGLVYCIITLAVPISKFYNMREFDLMLSSSFVFLGAFIGNVLLPIFTKYNSRRTTILLLMSLCNINNLSLIFVRNSYLFVLIRLLSGFCTGITSSLACNILAENLPIKLRGFFFDYSLVRL